MGYEDRAHSEENVASGSGRGNRSIAPGVDKTTLATKQPTPKESGERCVNSPEPRLDLTRVKVGDGRVSALHLS